MVRTRVPSARGAGDAAWQRAVAPSVTAAKGEPGGAVPGEGLQAHHPWARWEPSSAYETASSVTIPAAEDARDTARPCLPRSPRAVRAYKPGGEAAVPKHAPTGNSGLEHAKAALPEAVISSNTAVIATAAGQLSAAPPSTMKVLQHTISLHRPVSHSQRVIAPKKPREQPPFTRS